MTVMIALQFDHDAVTTVTCFVTTCDSDMTVMTVMKLS